MFLEYEKLVEGFRDKIRGNVSSAKLSPEEMQAEIAAVTENAFKPIENVFVPKRRGRPPGSRNRVKTK